jgi:hypothetical protein
MISRAYGRAAKPFVSLGEMNSSAFSRFSTSSPQKRDCREIDGA